MIPPSRNDHPCPGDRHTCVHDRSADGDGRTTDGTGDRRPWARRRLLATTAAAAGVALGGCLGGPGAAPEPVALSGGMQCDVCGMVIENHPGPNGQIFYRDHSPEGHDNPARFDSLKQCLFPYLLEHERREWTASAVYATDYSAVEYDVRTEGDATYISSHTEPGSFADAEDLLYVVRSDVTGAMGPDFVPFSERADAESLAGEHGGEVVEYDSIDEGLIGQ
jgi:nitrous oxide reductase accessory protein NosL